MIKINKSDFASSKGSINRHIVDGVSAYEYFSPKQIIKDLEKIKTIKFDKEQSVLVQANRILKNKDKGNELVYNVLYKYGRRLARILYILDNPTKEQRDNRKNYTEADWDYLKSIKKIYLAGGLLTYEFINIFKKAIEEFYQENYFSKDIVFIPNSSNLAIKGIARTIDENALIFDFGQTNVKVGIYKENNLILEDSIKVNFEYDEDKSKYASNCSDFILKVLLEKLRENDGINEIHLAISNYVKNGVIDPAPWYYGILHYFEPEYEKYLVNKLSKLMERPIKVKMYHDTSSMGLFIEDKKDSILISLGTAFGVCYFN